MLLRPWEPTTGVGLHGHMRIQMVQCPISFFATIPSALIHALDLSIPPPVSLGFLSTRLRNPGKTSIPAEGSIKEVSFSLHPKKNLFKDPSPQGQKGEEKNQEGGSIKRLQIRFKPTWFGLD